MSKLRSICAALLAKCGLTWHRIRTRIAPSEPAWSAAAKSVFGLWVALFLILIAGLVVPHFSVEKLAGLLATFAFLAFASGGLLLLFWSVGAMHARYRAALFFALPPVMVILLIVWGAKGALIGGAVVLGGLSVAVGLGSSLLRTRAKQATTNVAFLLVVGLLSIAAYALLAPRPDANPSLSHFTFDDRTINLPDPSQPGPLRVTTFTYGSGHDRHRSEYGANASIVTRPVDGSKIDTRWTGSGGWMRTHYWGFDARSFPIQGRVWSPSGPGPFPLVLMVHGNDWMEEPSDEGYAYLGQLLASQGFIFVSVDENFLNNSLADLVNPLQQRRGLENNARAWLLLEHLVQWRSWNQDQTNPMFGRVDMQRVALMGHSRGGEAVATAMAFNQLDRYPDDATQTFDFKFNLRAIAAIAPADGQYLPRGQSTPMRDTNYLVLQGSMDGDVFTFMGASQYERATFTPGSAAFKSSIYIKDADHTQFNTSWGRDDLGLPPFEFLLDERPLLSGETQRHITQVYISAFLQATLNGKDHYRALLQDPRSGKQWLPDGYMAANYADGQTLWLANCQEDLDPGTGTWPGSTIEGQNLTVWREALGQRKGQSLDAVLAVLAWDDRAHEAKASYRINFGSTSPPITSGSDLVFSASDAGISTLPNDFRCPHCQTTIANEAPQPLDWSVIVSDSAGQSARLPLSHDQVLYPQIKGNTRRIAAINSAAPSEIVLRRYRFPLRDFARQNPALDLTRLRRVEFQFDLSRRGAIALNDIGLAQTEALVP